jgi:hypothetical protein
MGLSENEFTAAEVKLKYGEDIDEQQFLLQKMLGNGFQGTNQVPAKHELV